MLRKVKKIHFKKIDSTSAYLLRRGFDLPDFTFVSADYQTQGKGRMERSWQSRKKENLLFSLLIKDKSLTALFPALSVATSVCVINALEKLGIKNLYYKWPNDVYVNEQKICGILLQSIAKSDDVGNIVIGVGLNVNQTEFDGNLLTTPTSIKLRLNKKVSVGEVKKLVYGEIIKAFEEIKKGDREYLNIAREKNYLKDKEVYAEIRGEKRLVKVVNINDDNYLEVDVDGQNLSLNAGEITFHK